MTTPVRLYPPFKSYTILHNPHVLPVIPAYNRTVIVKEARTLAEVSFLIPYADFLEMPIFDFLKYWIYKTL